MIFNNVFILLKRAIIIQVRTKGDGFQSKSQMVIFDDFQGENYLKIALHFDKYPTLINTTFGHKVKLYITFFLN
jgi:hypothetical protein